MQLVQVAEAGLDPQQAGFRVHTSVMPQVRVEGGLSLVGSRSLHPEHGKAAWRRGWMCGLGLEAAQHFCGQTLWVSAREGCA